MSLTNLNPSLIAAFFGITIFVIGLLILYYFKDKQIEEPSKKEKIAAFIWLVFRRTVCFLLAIPFGGVALNELFNSKLSLYSFFNSVFLFLMAAFFVWVGIYGQGWERYQFKDDKALHKKNKERYKWRL